MIDKDHGFIAASPDGDGSAKKPGYPKKSTKKSQYGTSVQVFFCVKTNYS